MSSSGPSNRSRPSKTNSPATEIDGFRPSAATGGERPTARERAEEFSDIYPERAETFLVQRSPEDPREPSIAVREEVAEEYAGDHYPFTWEACLREYLRWYERSEGTAGKFSDGEEEFTIPFENAWMPCYGDRYYARLMGLQREVEAEYEDLKTALLTLTASSEEPGSGRLRGPLGHLADLRESWTAGVYQELYRTLESNPEVDDWNYVYILEEHPGPEKRATAYPHAHPAIFVDGPISTDGLEAALIPVIEKHVEKCEGAEWDAHDIRNPDPEKRPIKTMAVDSESEEGDGKMNSLGGYLGKYVGAYGADPFEKDIERVAFESLIWATNSQKIRFSGRANEAVRADRCKQKAAEGTQEFDHGEQLAHNDGRGADVVCAGCGSSWGLDEDAETVVEARRPDDAEPAGEPSRRVEMMRTWKDTESGVRIDDDGTTAFSRPRPFRLEAIIVQDEEGEKEIPAKRGGRVDMVEVRGYEHLPLRVSPSEFGTKPPPLSDESRT